MRFVKIKDKYEEILPPFLFIFFAIFSKFIPLEFYLFTPRLELIPLFYFLYFTPQFYSYKSMIFAGIIYDIYFSNLIGISSLGYLIACGLYFQYRNLLKNRPFNFIWLSFLAFYLSFELSFYLIRSLIDRNIYTIKFILVHSLICFLLYPIFHTIFNKCRKVGIYVE
jgi:rod shape-determining protein MreD